MRLIISGEKGSGKTTACLKLIDLLRQKGIPFGGVVSPKVYSETGEVRGISVWDVGVKPPEKMLLASNYRLLKGPPKGPYSFSLNGIDFANKALETAAHRGQVVFADELGPLEMQGMGFIAILKLLPDPQVKCMVITVRPSLQEKVADLAMQNNPVPMTLSINNRDHLVGKILKRITSQRYRDS